MLEQNTQTHKGVFHPSTKNTTLKGQCPRRISIVAWLYQKRYLEQETAELHLKPLPKEIWRIRSPGWRSSGNWRFVVVNAVKLDPVDTFNALTFEPPGCSYRSLITLKSWKPRFTARKINSSNLKISEIGRFDFPTFNPGWWFSQVPAVHLPGEYISSFSYLFVGDQGQVTQDWEAPLAARFGIPTWLYK